MASTSLSLILANRLSFVEQPCASRATGDSYALSLRLQPLHETNDDWPRSEHVSELAEDIADCTSCAEHAKGWRVVDIPLHHDAQRLIRSAVSGKNAFNKVQPTTSSNSRSINDCMVSEINQPTVLH